jgi:hypothetical protein
VTVDTLAVGVDARIVFSTVTVDRETKVEAIFVVVKIDVVVKTDWRGQDFAAQAGEYLGKTVEVAVKVTVAFIRLATLQLVGIADLILVMILVLVIVVGLMTVLNTVVTLDTVKVVGLMRVLYLTSVFVFHAVAVLVLVDVFWIVRTAVSVTVRVFVLVAVQAVADAVMQRQALVTAEALSALYEAVFLDLYKVSNRPVYRCRSIDNYPERYEWQNATGDCWSFWMKFMSALLQAGLEEVSFYFLV